MNKGIAVADLDTCGGRQLGGLQSRMFYHGKRVIVVGDRVAPHGAGIHANAVMIEGSTKLFIQGKAVCREGDHASCGCITTGRPDYKIP